MYQEFLPGKTAAYGCLDVFVEEPDAGVRDATCLCGFQDIFSSRWLGDEEFCI